VREAAAPPPPAAAGQGLDSEAVRARMVERLRLQGVEDERVLQAMGEVPRHRFVDSALAAQAYEDTSLPIGWEQTISKPVVVARMIALLAAAPGTRQRAVRRPLGRTLEVGTGCGYQAAVLQRLSSHVTSIERLSPLHARARENLQALGLRDVRLLHGDGQLGHAPNAPYDSIVSAAGGEQVAPAWLAQLAVGGRLVAPVVGADGTQQLVVIDRTADGWHQQRHDAVLFVPLKSGVI
jgi:protein-L-isoaspartate(D-aspartate) O-methyltransferase